MFWSLSTLDLCLVNDIHMDWDIVAKWLGVSIKNYYVNLQGT